MRILGFVVCAGVALAAVKTPVKPAAKPVPLQKGKRPAAKGRTAKLQVPPRQLSPGPERNKEIQEALISKGYLQGPATGTWNQDTSDAMRKFQEKENLSPTGKISAKTLIGLGLGPKDESAGAAK